MKEFRDKKNVFEAEVDELRQQLADAEAAHKDGINQMERKLIEEKARLQKEAMAKLSEIKRSSEEGVLNRLDLSTKRILQQNRRLAEDLRLHVAETVSAT